ncbi:MAG: hypothetical protein ACLFN1_04490 [Bacteroidales bacterium]
MINDNKRNSVHDMDERDKGSDEPGPGISKEEKSGGSLKTHIKKIARPVLMLATAMIALVIISYTGLRLLLPEGSDINRVISRDEQQGVIENRSTEFIDAEKIAFFTRTMNLDPGEAELFWPVYNEFTGKRDKIKKERSNIMKHAEQYRGGTTGGEPGKLADRLISLDIKEAELKAEYHKRYSQILSPSSVIMLYYAENKFKDYMFGRIRSLQQ